jgi:membrane associated rhomboid family serine protease
MSWQERDYHRDSPGPASLGAGFAGRSVVFWLIVVNVAVFLLDHLLLRSMGPVQQVFTFADGHQIALNKQPIDAWGYFSAATAILGGQVWRFVTFQFLHASFGHILFNMLGLYFFGPMVESHLGSRRFLAFYLLCGVAGAVAYIGFWLSGFVVSSPIVSLVGASAGVLGVLIAAATIAPNLQVMLLFPPIPMKLKTMAWIMVGIGAYTVLFMGHSADSNAGGEAAHLGGCALGYLLIRRPWVLNFANLGSGRGAGGVPGGFAGGMYDRKPKKTKPRVDEREVDRILDKVREHGLASLTAKEQKLLKSATDDKRNAG